MHNNDYDDGNESPLNETSGGSTDSEVRLMKINEMRSDADLPPLLSRKQLIRQQRAQRHEAGPTFDDAQSLDMVDYGSANEEGSEGKLQFSDHESEIGDDEQTVVFNDTPRSRVNLTDLDSTQIRNNNATCERLDGLLKMATNLAQGPREEAVLLRKKNAEIMHFIQSQGHSVDDLNNHLKDNNMVPAREVDDNGLIVIQRKRDHEAMNQVFQHTSDGMIMLNNQLQIHLQVAPSTSIGGQPIASVNMVISMEPPSLTYKDVACGSLTSAQPKDANARADTYMRVSALDPRRLHFKPNDAKARVEEYSGLNFIPTVDMDMPIDNENVTVTVIAPPLDFLKSARENWNSSIAGYY